MLAIDEMLIKFNDDNFRELINKFKINLGLGGVRIL